MNARNSKVFRKCHSSSFSCLSGTPPAIAKVSLSQQTSSWILTAIRMLTSSNLNQAGRLPVDAEVRQLEVRVRHRVPIDVDQRLYEAIVAALYPCLHALHVGANRDVRDLIRAKQVLVVLFVLGFGQDTLQYFAHQVDIQHFLFPLSLTRHYLLLLSSHVAAQMARRQLFPLINIMHKEVEPSANSPKRFSLFYLDPGEVLLTSLQAQGGTSGGTQGTLILASRSILFRPHDRGHDIVRSWIADGTQLRYLRGANREHLQRLQTLAAESIFNVSTDALRDILKEGITASSSEGQCQRGLETAAELVRNDYILLLAKRVHKAKQYPIGAFDRADEIASLQLFRVRATEQEQVFRFVRWFDVVDKSMKHAAYCEKNLIRRILKELQPTQAEEQRTLSSAVELITIEGRIHCFLHLDSQYIHLRKILNNPELDEGEQRIRVSDITQLLEYRYLMHHTAVQLWLANGLSYLINFQTQSARCGFLQEVRQLSQLACGITLQDVTHKWLQGGLSNYQYLLQLNFRASRSFHDCTAYPIFPWPVHEYDIGYQPNNPALYRDLSKPISSINPHRARRLKDRQELAIEFTNRSNQDHLLPTYVSSPSYVYYFLLRKHPELIVRLQQSIIVPAGRVFNSIEGCYFHTLNGPADFKELIPEFFDANAGINLLSNQHQLELGKDQQGTPINDVKLPKWATSAHDFLTKMRLLLEGEHISGRLHLWIDLTFGWKTLPTVRASHLNDYNPLCYEQGHKAISPDRYRFHLQNFGQHPPALFDNPHPKKQAKQLKHPTMPGSPIVTSSDPLGWDSEDNDIALKDLPSDFFDDEDLPQSLRF